jgi:hypothetical protein
LIRFLLWLSLPSLNLPSLNLLSLSLLLWNQLLLSQRPRHLWQNQKWHLRNPSPQSSSPSRPLWLPMTQCRLKTPQFQQKLPSQ